MYQWFVVLHLTGLVVFVLGHGVSAFMAFAVRGRRDRVFVWELLEFSQRANRVAYIGLLLLVIGGIGAAAQTGVLTSTWVVATTIVLVAVIIAMMAIAAGFYYPIRDRIAKPKDGLPPLDGDDLAAALTNRRPDMLAAVGLGGLFLMVALMVLKPA